MSELPKTEFWWISLMTGDHSHRHEPLFGSDTHSQEPILGNNSKLGIFQQLQYRTICFNGGWSRDTKGTQVVLSRNYIVGAEEQSHQHAIRIGLTKSDPNISRTQLWLFLTNGMHYILVAKTDTWTLEWLNGTFTHFCYCHSHILVCISS